jgi:hypothetical protein
MSRLCLSLFLVVVAGCAPASFPTTITWTIDGKDPATVCPDLPAGTVAQILTTSRENPYDGDDVAIVGSTVADCGKGSATVMTGAFADVVVEVADLGATFGVSPPLSIAPGAPPPAGVGDDDAPPVIDVQLVRGTLRASLNVGGQSCGDAGASLFTVSLRQYSETRTSTVVVAGAEVPCTDGAAVFIRAPVDFGATYFIDVSTTINGEVWSTGETGQAVRVERANNAVTVSLNRR